MMVVEKMENPENNKKEHVPVFASFRASQGDCVEAICNTLLPEARRLTRSEIQESRSETIFQTARGPIVLRPARISVLLCSPGKREEGGQ